VNFWVLTSLCIIWIHIALGELRKDAVIFKDAGNELAPLAMPSLRGSYSSHQTEQFLGQ
jgi:hypothetical protein